MLRLNKGENAKEKQQCEKISPVYVKPPPDHVPSKSVGCTNPALQRYLKLVLKMIIVWESPPGEEPFQHCHWTNTKCPGPAAPPCALSISQNIQIKGWENNAISPQLTFWRWMVKYFHTALPSCSYFCKSWTTLREAVLQFHFCYFSWNSKYCQKLELRRSEIH